MPILIWLKYQSREDFRIAYPSMSDMLAQMFGYWTMFLAQTEVNTISPWSVKGSLSHGSAVGSHILEEPILK